MSETDRDVLFHVFGAVVKDVVILGGTIDCVSILSCVRAVQRWPIRLGETSDLGSSRDGEREFDTTSGFTHSTDV